MNDNVRSANNHPKGVYFAIMTVLSLLNGYLANKYKKKVM